MSSVVGRRGLTASSARDAIGDPFLEFRGRAAGVRLDLFQRPAPCVRIRRGAHVAFELAHASPAALETPEVQVAIPADLLLDEAATDLHDRTTRGTPRRDMKLSQY